MDDLKFRELKDRIKAGVSIISVIEESGAEFEMSRTRRGKWICGIQHDSLMVDEDRQTYTWFSHVGDKGRKFETGDVFDWLLRYRNMEFREAFEYLAQKAGVMLPDDIWHGEGEKDAAKATAFKVRTDTLTLAQNWFEKQLWATPAALDYARKVRGWDETTIRRVTLSKDKKAVVATGAGVGFSGGKEKADDLRGEFDLYGIDKRTPLAVGILGLQGGVKAWCESVGIQAQSNWLKHDRIYGLVDFPRLIYPHFWFGKVGYFSGRNLKWDGERLVGEGGKMKAYNPPVVLMGERQRFYNHHFSRRAERVWVVEGQADAITLGEWGEAAVALLGLGVDEALVASLKDVKTIYLALDEDKRGRVAIDAAGAKLGPMTQVVSWES